MECYLQENAVMGLRFTGHKYKYVTSLDIVDTDEKYIKELERQVEDAVDIWKVTNEQIYGGKGYIVEICNLKEKNRQLKSENRMIKKFLERAKIVVDEIR